ncbi:hypothetical protein M513_07100 [Trichuris suis]|uniref:FANCL C-terminal domain-containing protein n=1 Tax=Trichuris suis TaxID=68888 RepID=A0A085M422_9BILA|nr:hypothetical protein M513_07100 [Trichuris suis]
MKPEIEATRACISPSCSSTDSVEPTFEHPRAKVPYDIWEAVATLEGAGRRNVEKLPAIFDTSQGKINGVLENLQTLFDGALPELDSYDDVELERACNTSLDCLICQYDVDSNGRVADLLCDNCHGAYHAACIRKWVRRQPQRVISFGFVMGPCPHCSKMIKVSARA